MKISSCFDSGAIEVVRLDDPPTIRRTSTCACWPLRVCALMMAAYLPAASPGSTKPYLVITARAGGLPM